MTKEELIKLFEDETGNTIPDENSIEFNTRMGEYWRRFSDWIIEHHKAELAKKDAEVEKWIQWADEKFAEKDAEIERLKASIPKFDIPLELRERDEDGEIIHLTKAEIELQSLRSKMDKGQRVTMWKSESGILHWQPYNRMCEQVEVLLMEVEEK